ncbi:ion transporter [Candidatus Gracilibacteria bacterium]|nr:ion transporter [Candidatus Gracilibacteria bacterium]
MQVISLEKRQKIRYFFQDIFETHESTFGKFFAYFLVTLVCFSTLFFILETTEEGKPYIPYFHVFDIFVVIVFTIEYLARFFLATRKSKYMFSPLALVDVFVILTFLLSFQNFLFLRSFRVLKIFQMLKIIRYSDIMVEFFKTFKNYKNELKIFGLTLWVVLILSSCGLYYLEKDLNESFKTIPDAIWWAVVTISTVGYGDAVPITIGGKLLGTLVMFLGLAIIAIMTAIVTKMFIDHFFGKMSHICTFCRYPRHDFDARFCKNCGNAVEIVTKTTE